MTNMTKRQFKNERNLHKLFATNLPVVPIPADFAEHLVQSVLEEVALHQQNRGMGGEHRVLPTPKVAPPRRRLRVKRPPQALLLGIVCLWVSLLFLMSGCATVHPTMAELSQRSTGAVAQPPLAPLWPRLPVAVVRARTADMGLMATAFSPTQPATEIVATEIVATVAMLPTTSLLTDTTLVSQTAGAAIIGGLIAQEAVVQQAKSATATSPPAEVTSPPPTQPPATATASPSNVPTLAATSVATTPIPQIHPFLPTATPLPPTPTVSALPLPTYTPRLGPLLPTATPTL